MSSTDSWLRKNRSLVTALEEALKIGLFWVPDRYGKMDLVAESASSFVRVFSTVNSFVFHQSDLAASIDPSITLDIQFPEKFVFLDAWLNLTSLLLSHTQLVVEMLMTRHATDHSRWCAVLLIEVVKALIHLRQLVKQLTLALNDQPQVKDATKTRSRLKRLYFIHATTWWHLISQNVKRIQQQRKKRTYVSASITTKQQQLLMEKMLGSDQTFRVEDVYAPLPSLPTPTPPLSSVSQLSQIAAVQSHLKLFLETIVRDHDSATAAEIIHIIRPPLHVALIMRFGQRSWIPWVCAFFLEAWSYRTASHAFDHSLVHKKANETASKEIWTQTYKAELKRRSHELAVFMLRPPFVGSATRPVCAKLIYPFTRLPLVGDIFSQLLGLLVALERYHFYPSLS